MKDIKLLPSSNSWNDLNKKLEELMRLYFHTSKPQSR